jgi:predicted dehydrogenase
VDLFPRAWGALQEAVHALEDGQWVTPSGCTGWLVESTLHHLDLIRHLSGVDGPPPETVAATRVMVEKVTGHAFPAGVDDRDALRVATGCVPVPAAWGGFTPVVLG